MYANVGKSGRREKGGGRGREIEREGEREREGMGDLEELVRKLEVR